MGSELKMVSLALIRESKVALRAVNKNSPEYIGLVESIRRDGVHNPILVREINDNGVITYGLVDGLHRFTASHDAGLSEIPCHIKSMDDAALMDAQMVANLHRIQTKPVEYSKHLMRILSANPFLTKTELAEKLSVQLKFIDDRLSLVRLTGDVAKLVDDGRINLTNAYALAKLPEEEQANYVERAMTDKPQEFVPVVHQRVRELKESAKTGKAVEPKGFQPQPTLRKLGELKEELANPTVVAVLTSDCKTAADGFKRAVEWVLNMDPASQAAQLAKHQQREAEAQARKEQAKAEREKAKAEAAAKAAADINKL